MLCYTNLFFSALALSVRRSSENAFTAVNSAARSSTLAVHFRLLLSPEPQTLFPLRMRLFAGSCARLLRRLVPV